MNRKKKSPFFKVFPISGDDVCKMIRAISFPKERWWLHNIETLSDSSEEILGFLWRETRKRVLKLSTEEIISSILLADQVIAFDIRNIDDGMRKIFIEDGYLVDYFDQSL